jgi:transcription termination factor Rho
MPSNPRRHGRGRSSDRRPRESSQSDRPHRAHGDGGARARRADAAPRQPPPVEARGAPAEQRRRPATNGAAAGAGGSGGRLRAPSARAPSLNIAAMKDMGIQALTQIGKDLNVEGATGMRKQDLIFQILKAQTGAERLHLLGRRARTAAGRLRLPARPRLQLSARPRRHLRLPLANPALRPAHRRHHLGQIRPPREGERYFSLVKVEAVNFEAPDRAREKVFFENLTPLYPQEMIRQEMGADNLSARVMDLMTPIGKGQRGLIVAPPRTGKTMLLQSIAKSVAENHPEVFLIVLLIDERPEEVTDMQRSVKGEVILLDLRRARRSATCRWPKWSSKRRSASWSTRRTCSSCSTRSRAWRAPTTPVAPSSGKVLSGGLDSNALQKPKRFFGAARNIEDGGSLTIVATALIDTGSRMDDVIFEEFKGTGNSEIHLDRKLADKRVFPAIDITKSGTRQGGAPHSARGSQPHLGAAQGAQPAVRRRSDGAAARQARKDQVERRLPRRDAEDRLRTGRSSDPATASSRSSS